MMRFCGSVLAAAAAVLLQGCGASNDDNNLPPGTPRASDDILVVTATGATSLNVLANDADPDNDPLTVSITDAPFVGTATVNADKTIRLDLPAGFRGVTRFKYKVADATASNDATVVAFVDAPAYRVLFAGASGTQGSELYMTDLIAPVQLSTAVSGNLRLQNYTRAPKGSLVVYTRADPANTQGTTEMYLVNLNPVGNPVRIPAPAGRRITEGVTVAISPDDKWVAFATDSSTVTGGPTDLYVVNAATPTNATRVAGSDNVSPAFTQFAGTQPTLYFMASPPAAGNALAMYRASVTALDTPVKVSPFYTNTSTNNTVLVLPDESHILLSGTRLDQDGLFTIDLASPATETRLSTNMVAGEIVEALTLSRDFSQLVYLSRLGNSATARVSKVPTDGSAQATSVLNANLNNLSDIKPDGTSVLVTRGTSGPLTNGQLVEIDLSTSQAAGTNVASAVAGGLYDETGDRVSTDGVSIRPGVIARADFGGTPTPLISSSAPVPSFFERIGIGRSGALFVDSTTTLSLVNYAAPGKVFKLTTLTLDSGAELAPQAIAVP